MQTLSKHNRRLIFLFIPLISFILFIYLIPIVRTFYLAFQDPFSVRPVFSLSNFNVIRDTIWPTIWKTLVWTIGSIVPATILGFIGALVFQDDFRGKKWFLSICMLPYTIPLIIVATSWMLMYQQDFGLLNVLMLKLGLIQEPVSFLTFKTALTSVIIARIWRAMPFAFITYYAALKNLPEELFEAAEVDGASKLQKLFYVTIPQLKSVTAVVLIILTIWTFLVFDIIFGMTGGGPVDATKILAVRIYEEIFSLNSIGTASAYSVIAIIILLLLTALYWRFFEKGEAK